MALNARTYVELDQGFIHVWMIAIFETDFIRHYMYAIQSKR